MEAREYLQRKKGLKETKYKAWSIIWDWYGLTTKTKVVSPGGQEFTNFGKGYGLEEAKKTVDSLRTI